jgi:CHASE2 domain-containing sensor protein
MIFRWRQLWTWLFPPHVLAEVTLKKVLRECGWLCVICLCVVLFEQTTLFSWVEGTSLDLFAQVLPHSHSHDITIVQISDADFEGLFGKKRPLDTRIVERILKRVARSNPKVIGVDLELVGPIEAPPDARIVWARDVKRAPDSASPDEDDSVEPKPDPARDNPLARAKIALSIFPPDYDAKVRRYRRRIPVKGEVAERLHVESMDSMPWALVKEYRGDSEDPQSGEDEDRLLRFGSDFSSINFGELLTLPPDDHKYDHLLTDRIVLIGGNYADANDTHETPVGRLSGAKLIAAATQCELDNQVVGEMPLVLLLLMDFLTGAFVIYLNLRCISTFRFILALSGVVAASLIGSYFLFQTFGLFFTCGLVIAGILLHLQVDAFRERRRHHEAHLGSASHGSEHP